MNETTAKTNRFINKTPVMGKPITEADEAFILEFIKQFESFDLPKGEWVGELVYALPFSFARFCYFVAIEPAEIAGQKFCLRTFPRFDYKPSPDSCNMAKPNKGIFRLVTAPIPNDFDRWVKAEHIKD